MKMKYLFFTFYFLFASLISGFTQGIDFFDGSFEEALIQAQKEEKLIFVDAYATWCGPCKRMAREVFTDPSVGEYYNVHFISLKIDMEKPEGREFGRSFPVSAFPTLFYLNEKGELLKKEIGGRNVDAFLKLGERIAGSYDRSGELAKLYDEGARDYELVLKYIKALNNANKSSLKIANDFLRKNKDLPKDKLAEFLFESLSSSDSRIFDLFIENKNTIRKLFGEEAYDNKIQEACWTTIQTAIDYESTMLLEEAKDKMKENLEDNYRSFAYNADYEFAKATADIPMLSNSALSIAKSIAKEDAERLHDICNELMRYKSVDPAIVQPSETIAKMAVESFEKPEYLMTYSKILMENNKRKKAIKEAEKALGLTNDEMERKVLVEWINSLKAG